MSIIFDLATRKLPLNGIWEKKDYRFKFMMRSLLYFNATHSLLNNLSQRADFKQLLDAQTTLPSKPHRQYLVLGLSAKKRATAIIDNYHYIDTLPNKKLQQAFTAAEEVTLLQFTGKDDASFTITACCGHKADHEGETTLWLHSDNQLLASLTYSVIKEKDQYCLVIGGLQGPRRDVQHDAIKNATRACYGLFPKRLLMEFVWLLASHTNIKAILGVSNKGHVFQALRYRFKKARHFHASYDEFWQSIGGQQQSKYLWSLPLSAERKSLEEIPSKKRAEYRRRFLLLDDIAAQMATLTSPQP